jgi:hypothetical protein
MRQPVWILSFQLWETKGAEQVRVNGNPRGCQWKQNDWTEAGRHLNIRRLKTKCSFTVTDSKRETSVLFPFFFPF